MKIEYKTDIEEYIDCYVRQWWLRKSSYRNLFIYIILVPTFYFFIGFQENADLDTLLQKIIFILLYWLILLYFCGPGYRRKIKKMILESLDGEIFPDKFECEINETGIITKNAMQEVKWSWAFVKSIRPYKKYIEIQGKGFLIHLKQKFSPPIEDIIKIWDKAK